MTTELNRIAARSHKPAEPLTVAQKEALQRAVTKIVARGARVGVNRARGFCCWSRVGRRRAAGVLGGSIRRSCLKRSNLVLKFQAFAAGLAIE